MYKLIKGAKGERWMKDNKFIKASEVPEEVKQNYTDISEVNKQCIVCGEPKEHQRIILAMMVALCDDHYYNLTYGAVAGLLKKKGLA